MKASLSGFIPVVVFPVFMVTFLVLRHSKTDALKMTMMLEQKKLASQVETVANNARMIIDYQSRGKTMDAIEGYIRIVWQG